MKHPLLQKLAELTQKSIDAGTVLKSGVFLPHRKEFICILFNY